MNRNGCKEHRRCVDNIETRTKFGERVSRSPRETARRLQRGAGSGTAAICLQIHDRPVRDGARRRDLPREHKRRASGGRGRVQVFGGESRREGASRGPTQYLRAASCASDGQLRRGGRRDDRHQVSRRRLPDRQHHLGKRCESISVTIKSFLVRTEKDNLIFGAANLFVNYMLVNYNLFTIWVEQTRFVKSAFVLLRNNS